MARRRPSTEHDWHAATTAAGLLSLRFTDHRTPETPGARRKLRLVLCGAARTIWDRLPHDDLRRAVEVAERFADDLASRRELDEARQAVARMVSDREAVRNGLLYFLDEPARESPEYIRQMASTHYDLFVARFVLTACERSLTVARVAGGPLTDCPAMAASLTAWETMFRTGVENIVVGPDPAAAVVRDLFGGPTPFRFPDAWNTTTVSAIAAGIATDAAFDRLPVLADALEDAGCDSEPVLAHCRGPGPHWRGCWVVDCALGK